MLSAAYSAAKWAEYLTGVLALLSLVTIVVRLRRTPRPHVLGAAIALVVTGGFCLASYAFLRTEVVQVRLDSIKAVGLELRHAGLRTNAFRYDTQVSITAELKAPGALGWITTHLVHKTTTVQAQVAVYGLIDFTTVEAKVATVDRHARTITLSLPDPQINSGTTYIANVNGVQQREGPVTAIAQGIGGIVGSLLGLPVVSVDPEPELAVAESRALRQASQTPGLESCGKEEIVRQLTGIIRLTPAYRGYTIRVIWPQPPDPAVNCARLQAQFERSGT